jgi:hypothetical protein
MYFTHQNHLKYSIDGLEFGYRTSPTQRYKISLGSIDKDHYRKSNYKQELHRTADLIYQDYRSDIALFLSGGTDSEIVARNFVDIGIKPKCFVIKFKDDYNIFDVNEAIDLAKELDLPLNIIDFDVKEFFYSGEASEFGRELQCTQITYLMVYHSIKKIGMPAVMGGEVFLKRNINTDPSTWFYCIRENEDASAMRFSLKFNIPLVNEYFSYTPELLLYYLEDPDIVNLVSTKYNYKLTSVSSKNTILKKLVPEIRVRKKTHGFEKLLGFNFEAYRQLTYEQIMRLESTVDGIEINKAINILKGNE